MNICEICFRNLEKEPHQEWCKYYTSPESFEELFGFTKNEKEA